MAERDGTKLGWTRNRLAQGEKKGKEEWDEVGLGLGLGLGLCKLSGYGGKKERKKIRKLLPRLLFERLVLGWWETI